MRITTSGTGTAPTIEEIRNFKGQYPKQLLHLFFVEMWERFSFYGMRGMLAVFMVDQLGMLDKEANLKYGAIQAFVYAFTFVGGIFADRILGFKRSLLFGAVLMVVGNAIIAVSPASFFYFGITLSIIGTGFFKPNISSMVGELYHKGDSRRNAGFALFYSGINLGALLGGALCVYLGKYHSWSWAFLSASIVMTIGLLTFMLTKRHLGPIGDSPLKDMLPSKKRLMEVAVYVGALLSIPLIFLMINNTGYTDIFMAVIGPAAVLYFVYQAYILKDIKQQKKLSAAFILILFSVLFWAFFEQAGGSLALFAKGNLHHTLLFFKIDPNIVNNGANSLYVIALSAFVGMLWIALAKRKIEPNTVVKFGLGFVLLAGGYYVFYATQWFADANGQTSLNVFALAYLFVTLGELCLSPIGLSMITKLSPQKLSGMMMGLWFLASAYGQYVAGLLGAGMSAPGTDVSLTEKLLAYTNGYQRLALYALLAGVVLIILSPLVRKLMQEVR